MASAVAMWQEWATSYERQLQQTRLALESGQDRIDRDEVARRVEAAREEARAEQSAPERP